jgi:amidohydrolase
MMAEGLFQDFKPEAIFGLHVHSTVQAGEIGVRSGPFMAAADSFRILVKGRQTHGARPWLGVDPIVAAADLVGSAQSIVSRRLNISEQPAVLTFGAINGGNRANIIPDQVELIGTIRSFDPAMRQQAFDALQGVAEHVAAAHGASVETQIPDGPGVPLNRNDPALTARMMPSLRRAVGTDQVREIGLSTGAEDFAFYAAQAPTLFIYVGATPAGTDPATAPANHSPKFFVDERALAVGTRALLQLSLDYLNAGTVP